MQVKCFYDYTCSYSYKTMLWLRAAEATGANLSVDWRSFSLREANRDEGTPSSFTGSGTLGTSVLALALAHAARAVDQATFERYHAGVFDAMHANGARVDQDALLRLAGKAGVDTDAFERDQDRWVRAVREEHHVAQDRFNIFGTPTLVMENGATVFIKLAEMPSPGDERQVWEALCCLAVCHPEVLEIKRPPE